MAALAPAWAQSPQPVPALSGRVIDGTGTLDAAQVQALDAKLAALEQAKGSQVVVLMVPTTAPEDIAAYANRVANEWKIGRAQVGDGVLVLVAKDDRRMRIEVAKTLEGALPDLAAVRIIDQQMKPAFRQGDFAGGLNAAVDQIAARIKGEALPLLAIGAKQVREPQTTMHRFLIVLLGSAFLGAVIGYFGLGAGRGHGRGRVKMTLIGMTCAPVGVGLLIGAPIHPIFVLLLVGCVGYVIAVVLTKCAPGLVAILGSGGSGKGYDGDGWSGSNVDYSSSSSGGGFSSGGGGDFGGGGSSGSW